MHTDDSKVYDPGDKVRITYGKLYRDKIAIVKYAVDIPKPIVVILNDGTRISVFADWIELV